MRSRRPQLLMLGGRLAAAVLLALALLQASDDTRLHVSVLVDRTSSVSTVAATEAMKDLNQQIDRSRASASVSSYGGTERPLDIAVADALRAMPVDTRNALVIVSDGYWQADHSALLDLGEDIPVYWQGIPPSESAHIASVDAPSRARAGQGISLSVRAKVPPAGDYDLLVKAAGEVVASVPVPTNGVTNLEVSAGGGGVTLFDLEMVDRASGRSIADRQSAAAVNVIGPPAVLAIARGESPLATSLDAGAWPVTKIEPSGFAAVAPALADYGAIILDNVPVDAMPPSAWTLLSQAVQRDGIGLVVLGGSESFSLGGYRRSPFERLLPVISEPPDSKQPASVSLLIDVSGSMDRNAGNLLVSAQLAAIETANALRPVDRLGVIAFDVEARELLPLDTREDHGRAIAAAWPGSASGGTRMQPAFERALATLADDQTGQKLVLMLTDGMLSDDDVDALAKLVEGSDVEVIAIAVAAHRQPTPLLRVERAANFTILTIDDALTLPRLMRSELESRRPVVQVEETTPVAVATGRSTWPVLDAYVVTRARPQAEVSLESPRGDPLIASWTVGAGRVTAVPGGLGGWAANWLDWQDWPDFVGDLLGSVIVRDAGELQIGSSRADSGSVELVLDRDNESAAASAVRLIDAYGNVRTLELGTVAPRRQRVELPAGTSGLHHMLIETGQHTIRHTLIVDRDVEAAPVGQPLATRLAAAGRIYEWQRDTLRRLTPPASFRSALIALALIVLLLTLALERAPLGEWLRRATGQNR